MTKFGYGVLVTLFVLILPGCRLRSAGPDYGEGDQNKTTSPQVFLTPSQITEPDLLTPTGVPVFTIDPEKKIDQPPSRPSSAIRRTQPEHEFNSFCSYKTHTIDIEDQHFILLDYVRCLSHDLSGEYSRKKSWWDYFETLKPENSSLEWWRYAPDEDWAPAPLEYHDPIGLNMYPGVEKVYELDNWQITEEWIELSKEKLPSWHYQYQGDFNYLPSNRIPGDRVQEKFWEEGFVNHFRAEIWVSPQGYILKEFLSWDVSYKLFNGNTVTGVETISRGLENINQEIDIPDFVSPPVPPPLASLYAANWLEYGDTNGIWKVQVGKSPRENLLAYLQFEGEGYVIRHLEGNAHDGYSLLVEDHDNILWEIAIDPEESAKGNLVSILVMSQK